MAEEKIMEVDNNIPPPYTATEPSLPTPYNIRNQPPQRAYNRNPRKLEVDKDFLLSLDCVFLILEGILSFLVFVCAAADDYFMYFTSRGGGWIIFVGTTTFVCQVILFIMYLFRYIHNIPSNVPVPLVEMVYFALVTLCFFITGIIASVSWHWSGAIRACTVFCWIGLVIYGVDSYRRFIHWRNYGNGHATFSSNVYTNIRSPAIAADMIY